MANFMSLPTELRVMVYNHLLTEDVQPTARKYPRHIPVCDALEYSSVSKEIAKEAYAFYLSFNNIILDNSRAACLWL